MYILVIIGALLVLWASAHVNSTMNRYARTWTQCNMTGREMAEYLLRSEGINDVTVQPIRGNYTDHYDPRNLTVNLSDPVYNARSLTAVAVAAHECGHAMQDARNYLPLRVRSSIVPFANIGSQMAWPMIFIGLLLSGSRSMYNISWYVIEAGIALFAIAVLFQIVTLPVEFNASKRALQKLDALNLLNGDELTMADKVLWAAALTYVASAASSILQLLRLVLIFGGGRDRRR